jgi:hypothetical protein
MGIFMIDFTIALGDAFGVAPAGNAELAVDQLDGWAVPGTAAVRATVCLAERPVLLSICRAERPVAQVAAICG